MGSGSSGGRSFAFAFFSISISLTRIEGETALYMARTFAKNPELTAYLAEISEARDRRAAMEEG